MTPPLVLAALRRQGMRLFGLPATYTTAAGRTVGLRVRLSMADRLEVVGAAEIASIVPVIQILAGDLAVVGIVPAAGDTVTVGLDTYRVESATQPDGHRLVWRLIAASLL